MYVYTMYKKVLVTLVSPLYYATSKGNSRKHVVFASTLPCTVRTWLYVLPVLVIRAQQ